MPVSTSSPMQSINPAQYAGRKPAIDRLRGIAVMGILLMNIVGFGLPDLAYTAPAAWGLNNLADKLVWAVTFLFVDGKMRGIFAMLYGAGLVILLSRATEKGENGIRIICIRSFWLGIFGLAHYLLLWWGDILTLYAITGLVAVAIAGWQDESKSIFVASALVFALYFILSAGLMFGIIEVLAAADVPNASQQSMIAAQTMLEDMGQPGSAYLGEQVALYRGSFSGIFNASLGDLSHWLIYNIYYSCPEVLGFMLLGMGLAKNGFLLGTWSRDQYRRVAFWCFALGLPPMILLTCWIWVYNFDTLISFGSVFTWSIPFRIPLAIGTCALLLIIVTRKSPTTLLNKLEGVGKMSLSNYLGTSLLMTGFFYGWGFGYFGLLSRAQIYGIVPVIWCLMLIWSQPWISHFGIGPAEWLWRWLIRKSSVILNRDG